MGERLASWLVLSLNKYPVLSPQHNLFFSWASKDSYILLQVIILIFWSSVMLIHAWEKHYLHFPHTLLSFPLIAADTFPPSPMFSIPTSSNLCTFTKTQESHKGIWVLSLKNLFKHVTHYTIPTQKTHNMGCPKTSTTWINHTFWLQAASSAQIIASQMRMRTQKSSFL